jgi:hypothetical protein
MTVSDPAATNGVAPAMPVATLATRPGSGTARPPWPA